MKTLLSIGGWTYSKDFPVRILGVVQRSCASRYAVRSEQHIDSNTGRRCYTRRQTDVRIIVGKAFEGS